MVVSRIQLSQLDCRDAVDSSEDQVKFKYYCPICLRYFNHILESKCCHNYLCGFCVDDMKTLESKIEKKLGCPFGCSNTPSGEVLKKFELLDLKEGGKIKRYSDSQCMSYLSVNV